MLSIKKSSFSFALLLVFMVGCVHYVERSTPPGQVPPPVTPQTARPHRDTGDQQRTDLKQMEQSAQQTANQPRKSSEAPPEDHGPPLSIHNTKKTFKRIYRQKKSPKIAIFLNRSLSDEVREWKTEERLVLSAKGTHTRQSADATKTLSGSGGLSVYKQSHIENSNRHSPGESWMWRFEDGFLNPFLDVGASILDRATILRLTAAQSKQQIDAYNPISIKKVEMDSLMGKADLYIEILIRQAPDSPIGYEFKANAKEVRTGVIRANVTSLDWYTAEESSEEVIATDTGYQFVAGKNPDQFPAVHIVARDLAIALMGDLIKSWQQ